MKKNSQSKQKKPYYSPEDYDNLYTVNSGSYTDCTGLMYKPPVDEFEYESYSDVYHFNHTDFIEDYYGDEE
ncbi:MAG: hypothetical protein WCX81_03475 [Monoglobales bacterium]